MMMVLVFMLIQSFFSFGTPYTLATSNDGNISCNYDSYGVIVFESDGNFSYLIFFRFKLNSGEWTNCNNQFTFEFNTSNPSIYVGTI